VTTVPPSKPNKNRGRESLSPSPKTVGPLSTIVSAFCAAAEATRTTTAQLNTTPKKARNRRAMAYDMCGPPLRIAPALCRVGLSSPGNARLEVTRIPSLERPRVRHRHSPSRPHRREDATRRHKRDSERHLFPFGHSALALSRKNPL